MSELKKRKKSLNLIVNPNSHLVYTKNKSPLSTAGFKPHQGKPMKQRKSVMHNGRRKNNYKNNKTLVTSTTLNQFSSTKNNLEDTETYRKLTNNLEDKSQIYYRANSNFHPSDFLYPYSKESTSDTYPELSERFKTNQSFSNNLTPNSEKKENIYIKQEMNQETTNKKVIRDDFANKAILDFSNNSSKTQQLHYGVSSQKGQNQNLREFSNFKEFSNIVNISEFNSNARELFNLESNNAMQIEGGDSSLECNEKFDENGIDGYEERNYFEEEKGPYDFEPNNIYDFDNEALDILITKELEYSPDPNCFIAKQKSITPYMRAMLIDWMMEVCNEFTMKRETFHLSVNYIDRILGLLPSIQKNELQLIGIVAMFIASKVEEVYPPKLKDFAKSADNSFSIVHIQQKEEEILKLLKFMVNPPTIYLWANWFMTQWDIYIENSAYAKNHNIKSYKSDVPHFKLPKEDSYALFRELMQLLDCVMLDIETLKYKPRALILSFIYLIIGKSYQQFSIKQICEEMSKCNIHLLSREFLYNDLFSNFLDCSLGAELTELIPYIQFASKFFSLKLNFDLPNAVKLNKQYVLEGHFEEFLAYQTHNPENLDFIKIRMRKTMK